MDFLGAIELGYLYFIGGQHRPWLDEPMRWLTMLGDPVVLVPVMMAVAVVLGLRRRWASAFVMLLAPPLAWGLGEGVKGVVKRERPDVVWRLEPRPKSPSFPSGHTTRAMSTFALAGFLLARLLRGRGRYWVMALGIALGVLVGVSRNYLGVHWLTDVLAGWTLGLGWALLSANVAELLEEWAWLRRARA